jgi:uncharacterized protein
MLLLPQFAGVVLSALGRSPGEPSIPRGATAMLAAIRLYQREISARRAPCCRFSPSCMEYAALAVAGPGDHWTAARPLPACRHSVPEFAAAPAHIVDLATAYRPA